MLVQAGLCRTCSETTLLVFPRGGSYILSCRDCSDAKELLCDAGRRTDTYPWANDVQQENATCKVIIQINDFIYSNILIKIVHKDSVQLILGIRPYARLDHPSLKCVQKGVRGGVGWGVELYDIAC